MQFSTLFWRRKMISYIVYDIDLYLNEVGDGDPELQYTPKEESEMHNRCLRRWRAKDEKDLKNKIEKFIGYPVESIKYKIK